MSNKTLKTKKYIQHLKAEMKLGLVGSMCMTAAIINGYGEDHALNEYRKVKYYLKRHKDANPTSQQLFKSIFMDYGINDFLDLIPYVVLLTDKLFPPMVSLYYDGKVLPLNSNGTETGIIHQANKEGSTVEVEQLFPDSNEWNEVSTLW